MLRVLQEADSADVRKGSIIAHLWEDREELVANGFLAENSDDPRHVATLPLYQAHLALRTEYAKRRVSLGRLIAAHTVNCDLMDRVSQLIRRGEKGQEIGSSRDSQ
jgi:hypothetical protein